MSVEQVNQVIGRALLDESFRGQLLNNADEALKGFDLTSQEIEALKGISPDQFQTLSETFQAQFGGAEADMTQATNFLKLEHIPQSIIDSTADASISSSIKWIPADETSTRVGTGEGAKAINAWSSKIVPGNPAAAGGSSLLPMLAIGAGVVVVLGALAAGFFFFGGRNEPEQVEAVVEPIIQATPDVGSEPIIQTLPEVSEETLPQIAALEQDADSICLSGNDIHLCAVPAGQVLEKIGETAEDPVMLPFTPEQAVTILSAKGGSPPGVQGFTMMMLAGPETYRIQLPDNSENHNAIFLADAQGSPYFGGGTYFSEKTISSQFGIESDSVQETSAAIAGTWEDLSGPGTMTCNGASMNIPPDPVGRVVINDSGQGIVAEGMADLSTLEITPSSDGTYLAAVTTMLDGSTFTGQLQFSLVSPDVIEGEYTASYDTCTFVRSMTMTRISSAETDSEEDQAPLKPAEFSADNYFSPEDTFIPLNKACIAFPDVCKDELNALKSINPLIAGWGTFNDDVFLPGETLVPISQNCAPGDGSQENSLGGKACVPAPDQGDAFIPPYPADAGWGSKGIGNPTLVSVLDVNAMSVINGIFDLWMILGMPGPDDWDGFIDLNTELVQVYELDLASGQQTLWEEIKVTYDTVDITTDQNRLFIIYLFEDQATAKSASRTFP